MAGWDKLPNHGHFIGQIRNITDPIKKDGRLGIAIKVDINGNEFYRKIWDTRKADRYTRYYRELGYEFGEPIKGKYCVCSKQIYQGTTFLKISSVSDNEYDAFYEVQRLDNFEEVKANTKKEIDEKLTEIINLKNIDYNLIYKNLHDCLGKLKDLTAKRDRGNFEQLNS